MQVDLLDSNIYVLKRQMAQTEVEVRNESKDPRLGYCADSDVHSCLQDSSKLTRQVQADLDRLADTDSPATCKLCVSLKQLMEAYDYKCKQTNRFDKVCVVGLAVKCRLRTCKLIP